MKRAILAACGAMAFGGMLTPSAQTPTQPPTPMPSPSTPARTDDRTLTVTGCLKVWDASMGAVPPSAGGAVGTRYVLTNVETGALTADMPRNDPADTLFEKPKQYIVTAGSVDLATHLDHKVTLTGKASQVKGTGVMDAGWQTLAVSSLTMVAPTCAAQS